MTNKVTIMQPSEFHKGLSDRVTLTYEEAYMDGGTVTLTQVKFDRGTYGNGAAMVGGPPNEPPDPARSYVLEPGSAIIWHDVPPRVPLNC